MSHLSSEEQARLGQLAYWIREFFGDRGHNIGAALDHDPSFRVGERPRSSLCRAMMVEAIAYATSATGLGLASAEGGVRLVVSSDQHYVRRYRALAATRTDDSVRILSSTDSILQVEDDALFTVENWVLGYAVDDDNQIEDLFVAQVLDRLDGNPGELVLGPVYVLTSQPPTGGFEPTDEGLPGWEGDEEGGLSDAW